MKKLVFPAAFVLLVATVFLLLKYSVAPAPVKIMSPSVFAGPREIGEAVYKRFYDPLSRASFAVFGVPPQPEFHARVAEGFLAAARAAGKGFDVALADAGLPPLANPATNALEPFNFNDQDSERVASRLKELASRGQRVFVYTASVHSTHAIRGNAMERAEAALGQRLFAMTAGPMSLRATHEHVVDPPCLGIARDSNGTSPLGCLFLSASRSFYRKKAPLDRWVAAMVQPSAADFVLIVSDPEVAGRAERRPPGPDDARMPIRPETGPAGRTGSPVD